MDEVLAVIVTIVIVFAVVICVGVLLERNAKVNVCREHGYAGYDRIDRVPYCYGYTEGNKMFVKPYRLVAEAAESE